MDCNVSYSTINVHGDGDCFFSCLSLFLDQHSFNKRQYRQQICQFIGDNWESYQDAVKICHGITGDQFSVTNYADMMYDTFNFATAAEIMAASVLFDIPIAIWMEGNIRINHENRNSNESVQPFFQKCYNVTRYNTQSNKKVANFLLSHQHFQVMMFNTVSLLTPSQNTELNDADKLPIKKKKQTRSSSEPSIEKKKQTRSNSEPSIKKKKTTRSNSEKRKQTNKMQESHINNNRLKEAMENIKNFEKEQMAYQIAKCQTCHEVRLDMKFCKGACKRCHADKHETKMFSDENNMNPGSQPVELGSLTMVEEQLICRLAPAMSVHLMKHGGMSASGHCVTFTQAVDEPAKIFPRLPKEIHMLKVRRRGKNNSCKDFQVNRKRVENALNFLKSNSPAYQNITIDQDRLNLLPENGEINLQTTEYHEHETNNDLGPAQNQSTINFDTETTSASSVPLPDDATDIRAEVQKIVNEVMGDSGEIEGTKKSITITWPSKGDTPISEYTTKFFFSMAFPSLFPYAKAEFFHSRIRPCELLADWADHLMWYEDGRFARHPFFKFVVHNMIQRRRALQQTRFIVKNKLKDSLTVDDLREMINKGDMKVADNILYFSASLRGTNQYWEQRHRELKALLQYKIYEGQGLPSIFATGSCAEFYFKPLRRILRNYHKATTGNDLDLNNKSAMYKAVQENPHVVGHYFDLRTASYLQKVMRPVFGIEDSWLRYEFAKSRGMIHFHMLGWRHDGEPNRLLYDAVSKNLGDDEVARELAMWADNIFGMTAEHPAGCTENGPRKDLWPPPEGTAPPIPDEENPLFKILSDIADTDQDMNLDHLQLTNSVMIHRCSDYCLRKSGVNSEKKCRMDYGSESKPGKELRSEHALIKDKRGSLRLEMKRDHPMLVQHSRFHAQGWRANGDMSIIVNTSDPQCPSVQDIVAVEKYVSGYACKGNEAIGGSLDLFNDVINATNSLSTTSQALCTKLIMNSIKRDISSIEAAYDISSRPLYRCTEKFQYVALSGARVITRNGKKQLQCKDNVVDKYLQRSPADSVSLYDYVCRNRTVPVVKGFTKATWPLCDDYCRTILLLHFPNWYTIDQLFPSDDVQQLFSRFLESNDCPTFIKADVSRAKDKSSSVEEEDDDDNIDETITQPDWIQCVQPNNVFDDKTDDFVYDDGSDKWDWTKGHHEYPENAATWLQNNIKAKQEQTSTSLKLPDVNLHLLNDDQQFVFNIAMDTLTKVKNGE